MVQELLGNVRRHAAETTVGVELRASDGWAILTVTDDGRGFDGEETLREGRGMGLHAVREGTEALGGSVRIRSRPGAGTWVELRLSRCRGEPEHDKAGAGGPA